MCLIYTTEHELQNRLGVMNGLESTTLEALQSMMHTSNPFAQAFKYVGRMLSDNPSLDLKMTICETKSTSRQYSMPTASEIAGIMIGQGDDHNVGRRDILLHTREGTCKHISNLHRCYMSLLYVMLFPRGEDGWHLRIPYADAQVSALRNGHCVTQRQYYAYRLQIRPDTNACLLRGGRLLQQFMVDAYCSVEESRLSWLRHNQKSLRSEVYSGLADMLHVEGSGSGIAGRTVGSRIVLPSSFTGGPRQMYHLYQDAMAIVRFKGQA